MEELKEGIHTLYDDAACVMKDAHHILHEEAAEILAFLAVDSSRISIKGIPCHLPIAYVSLQLSVQNAVSAQPCVGKLGISLVLLNSLDCNCGW